jgi:hypothetical protein
MKNMSHCGEKMDAPRHVGAGPGRSAWFAAARGLFFVQGGTAMRRKESVEKDAARESDDKKTEQEETGRMVEKLELQDLDLVVGGWSAAA